jgi:hypothetical protein
MIHSHQEQQMLFLIGIEVQLGNLQAEDMKFS